MFLFQKYYKEKHNINAIDTKKVQKPWYCYFSTSRNTFLLISIPLTAVIQNFRTHFHTQNSRRALNNFFLSYHASSESASLQQYARVKTKRKLKAPRRNNERGGKRELNVFRENKDKKGGKFSDEGELGGFICGSLGSFFAKRM